jgi:large subunit ribosomal protein L13
VDKTFVPKGQLEHQWVLIDANGKTLGRLATQISHILLGKDKPAFTPGVDMGAHVVVINANSMNITQKRLVTKFYYHHSNYPGGLKTISLQDQLRKNPERVIQHAVKGMLPHNKLGRHLLKKIRVYSGAEHPHIAQNPELVA